MTEIEELKKKLEKMEKENAQLRSILNRQPRVKALPSDIVDKYPLLSCISHGYASSEPWMSLLRSIRAMLFPEAKKCVVGQSGKPRDINISCQDMNKNQYSIYLETLDGVLSALNAGRKKSLDIQEELS